ncbi:unnamed protein product [Adineta steineri]|uniref:NAD(P)(+)--arginine ADP-ribosyltransferase n=1 Tax=Adineta steineri TaxID=433720 RepID=A0A818MV10_9BILA|nr:unnamed protein product [Adineta steineri]CAF1106515.1 unnamed protein product [Adineta steineri]CAF3595119.1 unnamed protein product [Adineta steineri]CAF4156986.1 unnamed protein product [Adineta steineri]
MDTITRSIERRRRIVQNHLLIWLHESIDETSKDYKHILTQIQTDVDNANIFTQRDECVDFLSDNEDVKSFLVVDNTIAQQIVPLINDIPHLDSVYIFNAIKILHEEWTKKWQKIKSVHTNIDDLYQALQIGIKQCNQDSIAMSFITVQEMASTENINQLEPTFMYTQLFKEILLNIKYNSEAIKDFITYCRQNNSGSPINIDRFEKEYDAQTAIWWYTRPSFIYSMLNDGLRSMEADTIINMGFFIHDLHQQIQQLHQQQVNSHHGKPFTVYRGQGLSKANFEKLQRTKGCLVSFNNFLSTSTKQDIALRIAYCASGNVDTVAILFIMSIDPSIKAAPFSSIKEKSYFTEEDEILFSMHTVFRVGAIKQMDINNQLYQIELQLTSDDDQQLRLLTDRIREEVGGTGWQRLGDLLLKIGQYNKAEELYNVLLKQTSDKNEKALYYNQLGCAKDDQGDYEKAIWYYEQGLEIDQETLPPNHSDLATSYSNIGLTYNKMGECSKALLFYEKGLKIFLKSLPSDHPDLATSYNNIGIVYDEMGEYSKALLFYEKALEIYRKTLPSNHPSLATSYDNIGGVYDVMEEYSKALSFYEEALEIRQKTLPSNHPHLATSYNNTGRVYDEMGEYSKALSFYEKALEIYQKTLPSNHSSLATSYDNIGGVYDEMTEYSKALSFYEEALEIRQKTVPPNHLDLATSYNNIGIVYDEMGEYSKALSFYENALEIYQRTLPSNQPLLAISYNNIGTMYGNMEAYSEALSSHKKALEIYQKTLPSNHPDLAISYYNIAKVYYNMDDYSEALSYFGRALDIYQRVLPPSHPDIKIVQDSIEIVKEHMIENS